MKNRGPQAFDADFDFRIRGLKRGSVSKITKMGIARFGGAGEMQKKLPTDQLTHCK
jgi:hypothetical protein